MTARPRNSNPQRMGIRIRGSSMAGWRSKAPAAAGWTFQAATQAPPGGEVRIGGRITDGLPNPQAFSLPLIQTYPARTATCRQCPELELHSCARGCCKKLSRGHSFILNAIADGDCPLGKFTQEL